MTVVARLKQDGELLLARNVDTRNPIVQNGLMLSQPFDSSVNKGSHALSNVKILGYYTHPTHPLYDYLNANAGSMTLSADITAEVTATVKSTYDLVVVDQYAWAVSSAIMTKLKDFVDAGISVVAVGNDTRANVFVSSYTTAAGAAHNMLIDDYGIIDTGTSSYTGSTDLIGGIDSLQNGAITEYTRSDTGKITGYSYTSSTSGATLFFEQEGVGATTPVLAAIDHCIQTSKGRKTETSTEYNHTGFALRESSTNLYADGNYASKTLHPVRFGPWTFPTSPVGPDGQQVLMVTADGTNGKYHGRDITVVIGLVYSASCWCFVSNDSDSTTVHLAGEQGYAPDAAYDITKKGIWQKISSTGTATTTNARILAYQKSDMTTGYVLFTEVQFEQKKFPTQYTETTSTAGQLQIEFEPLTTCTIIGKFKPYSPFEDSPNTIADYLSINDQSSLMGLHGDGGNIYYRFWQTATGNSHPFLDPDGIWGIGHVHKSYTLTTDELYYKWVRSGTTLIFSIYQNGTWKLVHTFSGASAYNINKVSFGTTTIWNGEHSNLAIYDSALSDAEIDKIIKGTHTITANGLTTNELLTKPKLPVDVSWFDLGADGSGIGNSIVPFADTANYLSGTAYVGGNQLLYNLNSSIGMDWNGNWSICYMKKPIGTHLGEANLTGYSLESLGSNSNVVGGGYIWWGKVNGSNTLSGTTNPTISQLVFFNNWQYITMVKSGTTLTIETWLNDKVQRIRIVTLGAIATNYYVNQYGYDFFLGGWDNNNGCYTHFKNLVISQRALTTDELSNFRLNKIRALKNVVHLQTNFESNAAL